MNWFELVMGLIGAVMPVVSVWVVDQIKQWHPLAGLSPRASKRVSFLAAAGLTLLIELVTGAPQVFGLPAWAAVLAAPISTWLYELRKLFRKTPPPTEPAAVQTPASDVGFSDVAF